MLLNVPFIVDMRFLKDKRQVLIDEKLMQADRSRISYDYRPADEVLVLVYKSDKFDPGVIDPFRILRVHVNEMVAMRRNARITECINFCRVRPCWCWGFSPVPRGSRFPQNVWLLRFSWWQVFPSFLDSYLLSFQPMFILPMRSFASFFMRGRMCWTGNP